MLRLRQALLAGCGMVCVAFAGCRQATRALPVVPALPSCLPAGATVTEVNVSVLGDFPPTPSQVAAISATGMGGVGLTPAARVVEVDGLGGSGLVAFGRTAPLDGSSPPTTLSLAYGPPDTLCATASMHYARVGHRATLLPSGAVLISGGADRDGFGVTPLERYLPYGDATGGTATFDVVDSGSALDPAAVLGHAVSVLSDGQIVVSGGAEAQGGAPSGIAYAGLTRRQGDGTVVAAAQVLPGGPRSYHAAVVLADGRVALLGGCAQWVGPNPNQVSGGLGATCAAGQTLSTTELLDATGDPMGAGPPLSRPRVGQDAALLPDGMVLLVGGVDQDGAPCPPEIWSAASGTVSTDGSAQLFAGGATLSSGGWVGFATVTPSPSATPSSDGLVLWLPESGALALSTTPVRTGAQVTALEDGTLLVAGGVDATTNSDDSALLVVDPFGDARGAPTRATSTFSGVGMTATRLGDGSVFLAGGTSSTGPTAAAAVYLHSRLGPYANLPALVLDAAADPLVPRRFDRVTSDDGHLVVDHPLGDPALADWALVGGMVIADFDLTLRAGRSGPAQAMILAGYRTASDLSYISLADEGAGGGVRLVRVAAAAVAPDGASGGAVVECSGAALPDGVLPDGDLAPLHVRVSAGEVTVQSGSHTLLSCRPHDAIGRGQIGVGSLGGTTWWSDLTVTRLGSP